ncbi:MAG: hypothetical protein IKZ07_04535 [Akkermansia sp.]|nr:hypothetical protein [Akkermansia sp.]
MALNGTNILALTLLISMPGVFPALAAELKRRPQSATVQQVKKQQILFSHLVLQTISRDMPQSGGYSATPLDVERLAQRGVQWNSQLKSLVIHPGAATPTFCSAACYMVLLRSLQRWEVYAGQRLPHAAWQALDVQENQPDGIGAWGRANANGPGLAKLVHDLKAGVNFSNLQLAQPGDFLKFFWTKEIGVQERGHLVVYLGTEKTNGVLHVKYWSANKPGGFGIKSTPLSRMHNLIFTRITNPQNFARVHKMPEQDSWLRNMQQRSFSFDEVRRACNIVETR